jgi:hypothetical protein
MPRSSASNFFAIAVIALVSTEKPSDDHWLIERIWTEWSPGSSTLREESAVLAPEKPVVPFGRKVETLIE